MHSLLVNITTYSYFGIFVALALGILGLPIPDETLMAYAGFLAFQGKFNFLYSVMVAFVGTSFGITFGYVLGRRFGNPIIKRYSAKMYINSEHIQNAERFYNRYGKADARKRLWHLEPVSRGYPRPERKKICTVCLNALRRTIPLLNSEFLPKVNEAFRLHIGHFVTAFACSLAGINLWAGGSLNS